MSPKTQSECVIKGGQLVASISGANLETLILVATHGGPTMFARRAPTRKCWRTSTTRRLRLAKVRSHRKIGMLPG
jgi:hypothetical protein